MRAKRPAQEQFTMTPARAQTQTTRSQVRRANLKTTTSLTRVKISYVFIIVSGGSISSTPALFTGFCVIKWLFLPWMVCFSIAGFCLATFPVSCIHVSEWRKQQSDHAWVRSSCQYVHCNCTIEEQCHTLFV